MEVGSDSLTLLDSLILGVVQGITEFFPVSSDGHLVIGHALLNYQKNNLVFDVLLHFGTLLAIIVAFRKETRHLILLTFNFLKEILRRKSLKPFVEVQGEMKWMAYIWWTTFITGIFGLLFEEKISELFESVQAAGVGFLITSVFLFAGTIRRFGTRKPATYAWWFPILIGLAQASALLPGVSRSGMTIALALFVGVERREAGKFSFVAAIPIILLAVIYQLRHLVGVELQEIGVMSLGIFVSFLVGLLAIKGLMYMLTHLHLYPFAIYTGLLGLWTLLYFG